MAKSRQHRELLNYIYNDLKITKDDIREWTLEAVDKAAQRYVDKQMETGVIEKLVREALHNKDYSWWGDKDTFNEWIQKEVAHKLLTGVKLKVEIVNKNETKPNQYLTMPKVVKKKS